MRGVVAPVRQDLPGGITRWGFLVLLLISVNDGKLLRFIKEIETLWLGSLKCWWRFILLITGGWQCWGRRYFENGLF